ncbi:glucose-6-phosphate dehydrogenase [Stakelama sediminis]|uniref:Glucose-6-phosphate 1-dehydrogenase n=1 Tax=Stakelama sediminis TaxID=463200 RepID=A0A840YWD1_9SPHN|nr:glucose-6-phosphate dehydrogenase [Stakelama sediminis]MBB5717943.1 glucose-6-phosphate 1-dehydrogenase [Stakelama sediminis]
MSVKVEAAPAATLVIFGATGDLAHRLLMPSLANMTAAGLIDDNFRVLGIGRSKESDEELRTSFDESGCMEKLESASKKAWKSLRKRVLFEQGDFTRAECYEALKKRLDKLGCGNVAFYLAVAPRFFGDIVEHLGKAGLLEEKDGAFRRVAIEKPFGHDLQSAKTLNKRILAQADESQFYRIDHFLGKETVQNILVARFANAMTEAVWNRTYIDHVQITAAETVDVGTRGDFYDHAGALRDMVPNHLFQLLSMVAMEAPNRFDADSIRDEKSKLLKAIRIPSAKEAKTNAVRGQYGAGTVDGKKVVAYTKAPDVAPDSTTETYAALKLEIDTPRWAGVPFYLRTGKALGKKDTEVVLTFRPVAYAGFRDAEVGDLPANKLVIQIQPDEGIDFDFLAKQPGPAIATTPVTMAFRYADHFDISHTTGYETLLYDLLRGDQTLFQRADGIEAAWAVVQPILNAWKKDAPDAYRAGSTGPATADALLERDGRKWHVFGE